MGRVPREKPKHLAKKLLQIRIDLNLSQNEMLARLGLSDKVFRSAVSGYELGKREPPLPVLLKFARLANVYVDALIDDEIDLPQKLPSRSKSAGVKRRA